MGYLKDTTAGLIMSVGALTLCSAGVETLPTPYSQESTKKNIELVYEQTQVNKNDYVSEKYSYPINNEDNDIYKHFEFFNSLQSSNLEFKNIDPDILEALNEFEFVIGKKEPSRKRF